MTFRPIRSLGLAILLLLISTVSASAKLSATLSREQARPGEVVTLTTGPNSEGVSQGGQAVEVYLLAGVTDPTNRGCQASGAVLLGALVWDYATGVGTLAFTVPAVSSGSHLVEVLGPKAIPGCWPEALLTVLPAPLPATDPAASPRPESMPWPVLAVAAAGGAVVGRLWFRRRRFDQTVAR